MIDPALVTGLINLLYLFLVGLVVCGTYLSWRWEPWYFTLGPVVLEKKMSSFDLSGPRQYLADRGHNLDGSYWFPPILARELEPGTYALRQQISSGSWMDFNPMFFLKGIVKLDEEDGVLRMSVSLNWPMTAFSALFLVYLLTVVFRESLGTESIMPTVAVAISCFYLVLAAAHFLVERWRYNTIFRKLTDR